MPVRIWDAVSGTTIRGPLEGHSGAVFSVAFSPDGTRVGPMTRQSESGMLCQVCPFCKRTLTVSDQLRFLSTKLSSPQAPMTTRFAYGMP